MLLPARFKVASGGKTEKDAGMVPTRLFPGKEIPVTSPKPLHVKPYQTPPPNNPHGAVFCPQYALFVQLGPFVAVKKAFRALS